MPNRDMSSCRHTCKSSCLNGMLMHDIQLLSLAPVQQLLSTALEYIVGLPVYDESGFVIVGWSCAVV